MNTILLTSLSDRLLSTVCDSCVGYEKSSISNNTSSDISQIVVKCHDAIQSEINLNTSGSEDAKGRLNILRNTITSHFQMGNAVILCGRKCKVTLDIASDERVSVQENNDDIGLVRRFFRALFDLFIQPLIDQSCISRPEQLECAWNVMIDALYVKQLSVDIDAYVKMSDGKVDNIDKYFVEDGTLTRREHVLLIRKITERSIGWKVTNKFIQQLKSDA